MTIIINDAATIVEQWLRDHGGDFDLDVIVRSTPSSYASFQIIADRLADAPAVITTIDTVMPVADFIRFVKSATTFANDAIVLGLTDHVDDEKPLWVTLRRRGRPHSAAWRQQWQPCDGRALLVAGAAAGGVRDQLRPAPRLSGMAGC